MLECNVAITKLSNAIVPTSLTVPEFPGNSPYLSGIIVYVSSLVFVFFVLTQGRSVTDSIKELLSGK